MLQEVQLGNIQIDCSILAKYVLTRAQWCCCSVSPRGQSEADLEFVRIIFQGSIDGADSGGLLKVKLNVGTGPYYR